MRTRMMVALTMGMMLISFSSAFADDITLENRNTNTSNQDVRVNTNANANATGGAANATGGNASLVNNQVTPIQPYVPSSAGSIQPGANTQLSAWVLYMGTEMAEVSYEEVANMDDFSGMSNWWNDRFVESIAIKGLPATKSISIAPYYGKGAGDKVIGYLRIFGTKKDIQEALLAGGFRRAMDAGADKAGVLIRTTSETDTKGVSINTGAGGGLYVPCNNGVGIGTSLSAYLANVKSTDSIEFRVIYLKSCATPPRQVVQAPPPPPVKVETPCPPEKEVCNPAEILIRLHKAEVEIAACLLWSYNNFFWQNEAGKDSINAFLCTGNRQYLLDAIEHYQMAELNYIHGSDISNHNDSRVVLGEIEYGLASAIYARDNSINAFWKAPEMVKHRDKKTGADRWVKTTKYEKVEIIKLRKNLESYSTKLTL